MKITKKQTIGENLLYVMVWSAIILVPVLNSLMMSELHVSWENVLIAWRKIAPYLIIFIVHNSVIAPRFMLKHKYWKYLITNLTLIIGTFWFVDFYEQHITDSLLFSDLSEDQFIEHRKASFTDLEMYWNVILGFFMSGANTGIKLMYQSIRDEQQMEELKQQNMQAEMDYLKYQINPHFFMNTLNNIHALIDIDTEYAKNAVIGPFGDAYSTNMAVIYDQWGRERVRKYVMGLIRRYKPDVVVTHDRGGEYGHGAHKVTADASVYCVENAANPSVLPALCEAYGAWTVKKLYLHMGEENVIRMDWNVPLSAMGGKTGEQLAHEDFLLHVTQQKTRYVVTDEGKTGNAKFSLVYTTVGPDIVGGDLFENV